MTDSDLIAAVQGALIVARHLPLVRITTCGRVDRHGHGHGHGEHHGLQHAGDNNLRAAYLHVLADALTSVLVIVALVLDSLYGWNWMDPAMGIIGGIVIARWSWGLIRDAGGVLLKYVPADENLPSEIRDAIEVEGEPSSIFTSGDWGLVIKVRSCPFERPIPSRWNSTRRSWPISTTCHTSRSKCRQPDE